MAAHETYMAECLALAAHGAGNAAPNPMVGAVIVHRDRIIGRGFHEQFGGPHAEVNAVRSTADSALLRESTLYVSLEPCCHFGKTPPCTDLIIGAQIPRVVVGVTDPFAAVSGGGIKKLRAAGIEVVENILAAECAELNRRFFTFHREQRPYVVLKWAETGDGFIARADGSSKWISGETARTEVHRWRAEEAAIMVGARTAAIDDPALTVRGVTGKNPLRIVVDSAAALAPTLQLFDRSTPTVVFNTVRESVEPNLEYVRLSPPLAPRGMLAELHRRGVLSVLVEGGSALLTSFIESGLWDEARIFTNPTVTFETGLAAPVMRVQPRRTESFGGDTLRIVRRAAGSAEPRG